MTRAASNALTLIFCLARPAWKYSQKQLEKIQHEDKGKVPKYQAPFLHQNSSVSSFSNSESKRCIAQTRLNPHYFMVKKPISARHCLHCRHVSTVYSLCFLQPFVSTREIFGFLFLNCAYRFLSYVSQTYLLHINHFFVEDTTYL